jgi:TctA family transporter
MVFFFNLFMISYTHVNNIVNPIICNVLYYMLASFKQENQIYFLFVFKVSCCWF